MLDEQRHHAERVREGLMDFLDDDGDLDPVKVDAVAVGMVVELGVIHAWFYAPQGTLYASLFPTRIRYTGLSTIYQVSGIYASDLTPLILPASSRQTRRPVVCVRLFGCDCGAQRGRDGTALAEVDPGFALSRRATAPRGVAGQSPGIGPADVLWSSCDCSDR